MGVERVLHHLAQGREIGLQGQPIVRGVLRATEGGEIEKELRQLRFEKIRNISR